MIIKRGKQQPFIAASHEDPINPGSLKKVLYTINDFPQGGKIQMINWAKIDPGKSFRDHYHEDMDEVFIIIKGSAKIFMDGTEETVQEGDAIRIPAGSRHKMKNIGNTVVEYLVVGVSQGKNGKTVLTHL